MKSILEQVIEAVVIAALVLSFGILVTACGRDESTSNVRAISSGLSVADGKYVSGCLYESQYSYMIASQEFKNGQVSVSTDFFPEKTCSTRYMNVTLLLNYSLSDRSEGGYNADYTIVSEKMTLSTADLISRSNSEVFLGSKDWKLDVAKDITNKSDAETVAWKSGDKIYGILKVSDNSILVGDTSDELDGSTPDKRPVHFSTNARLKK